MGFTPYFGGQPFTPKPSSCCSILRLMNPQELQLKSTSSALYCNFGMKTSNFLTRVSQPTLTCRTETPTHIPLHFLSVFQPALTSVFRLPWGGNYRDCRTTTSVVQSQAALKPLEKMERMKTRTSQGSAEEEEGWNHTWGCPVAQKARTALLEHQVPATQHCREKR